MLVANALLGKRPTLLHILTSMHIYQLWVHRDLGKGTDGPETHGDSHLFFSAATCKRY